MLKTKNRSTVLPKTKIKKIYSNVKFNLGKNLQPQNIDITRNNTGDTRNLNSQNLTRKKRKKDDIFDPSKIPIKRDKLNRAISYFIPSDVPVHKRKASFMSRRPSKYARKYEKPFKGNDYEGYPHWGER